MAFTDPTPTRYAAASIAGIGMGCLFFILLVFPVMIAIGLGACDPNASCDGNVGHLALLAFPPSLLLAAALRSVLLWLGSRIRAREPDPAPEAVAFPWWSLAAIPLAVGGGSWLVWGEPIWSVW